MKYSARVFALVSVVVVGCESDEKAFVPVEGCDADCVAAVAEQVVDSLVGKIYVRSDSEIELNVAGELRNSVLCDQEDTVLSGGCSVGDEHTPRAISGSTTGTPLRGWSCRYLLLDTDIVENLDITATAVCLDSSDL